MCIEASLVAFPGFVELNPPGLLHVGSQATAECCPLVHYLLCYRLMATKSGGANRLLIQNLHTLWSGEQRGAIILLELAEAASNPNLRSLLADHARQASAHLIWLEDIFQLVAEQPGKGTNEGFEGLLCEATILAREQREQPYRDLAITQIAQLMRHHEIAIYSNLATIADAFDLTQVVERLTAIVLQKSQAIRALHSISEELALRAIVSDQ